MTPQEAAELIDAIANSLESHPDQFTISVSVIGTTITSTGEGTGLSVTATGGGPGSTTTGFHSQAAGGDVQIEKTIGGVVDSELAGVISTLRELAHAVASGEGEPKTLIERLNQYAALPASLGSVVSTCLNLAGVV